MNNTTFNKMIILKPEVYEKMKQNADVEVNELDKAMKKILLNKHMTDTQKWYFYRQYLFKIRNKNRVRPRNKDEKVKITETKGTQTRAKPMYVDVETQSNVPVYKDAATQAFPQEDVYEKEVEEVFDDEMEEEVFKKALSATSAGERLRKRKSIRNKNVQIFETDTGDIISVPLDSPSPPTKKEKTINSKELNSSARRVLRSAAGNTQTELNFPIRKNKSTSSWTTYK